MTEAPNNPSLAEKDDMPKLCKMLYGIFAISLLLQFVNLTAAMVGSIAVIAGVIVAYSERRKAAGTVYANHLQWLIRTFWIGGSVYLPVVTVLGAILLLFITDHSVIDQTLNNPDANTTVETLTQQFVAANATRMKITMFLFIAPFAIWWLWRCWYGWKRLMERRAIPNVMSWI